MDGKFWCRPNWGSSVFDEFWEECEANGDKINIDEFNWWYYQFEHYVDLESAPSCATYLYEWTLYGTLEDAAIEDFSTYLGLALAVLSF